MSQVRSSWVETSREIFGITNLESRLPSDTGVGSFGRYLPVSDGVHDRPGDTVEHTVARHGVPCMG